MQQIERSGKVTGENGGRQARTGSASIFGPGVANIAGDDGSNFTVLSDGRYVEVYQGGGPFALAQFYAPDGAFLGAPVALNPLGAPDFTAALGFYNPNPDIVPLANGGFAALAEQNQNGTTVDFLATFDAQGNLSPSGWTALQTPSDAPNIGQHTLVALPNGGYYVAWNTNANPSGTPGGSIYSSGTPANTSDGQDVVTAFVSPDGVISTTTLLDAGTQSGPGGTYNGSWEIPPICGRRAPICASSASASRPCRSTARRLARKPGAGARLASGRGRGRTLRAPLDDRRADRGHRSRRRRLLLARGARARRYAMRLKRAERAQDGLPH